MTIPLLQTKFYVPPVRSNLVPRRHLIERLDEGLRLGHRLTLVSAPAGFGKTTLLSEWASRRVSESASQRVSESASRRVSESASRRVSESAVCGLALAG
jgi:LuxR family maltose regulon positive regulatory protein